MKVKYIYSLKIDSLIENSGIGLHLAIFKCRMLITPDGGEEIPMGTYLSRDKIKGFMGLSRPFTLFPPAVAVISGGLIALGHYGHEPTADSLLLLVFAGALLAVINAASNAINQAFDADIDAVNKPTRPIPSGTWSKGETIKVSSLIYLFAFILAFVVGRPFALFALLFILITILYSIPPLRLKKRLWGSNITIAVARSWLLLLAGWSVFPYVNIMEPTIWYCGLIMFVFLFGASTTKDFTDIKGDREYGMNTLPVVYGVEKTALIISPFFVLPFLLIPLGATAELLPLASVKLTPMIGWGFYVVIILGSVATEPSKKLENSKMWFHMYMMMMALMLGLALVYF